MINAYPFLFTANVRMQDAMLYSPKIKPMSWLEDIALDSIKSFDLLLDKFEITVKANSRPNKSNRDGV